MKELQRAVRMGLQSVSSGFQVSHFDRSYMLPDMHENPRYFITSYRALFSIMAYV